MGNKIKVKVNLGDIQNKIWGEIVQDFSIQDLENAKQEWIENLIEIGAKQVGDEALLNDLCNFLNKIEFEEEQKETEYNILLKNGRVLTLDSIELDTLYMKMLGTIMKEQEKNGSLIKRLENAKIKLPVSKFIDMIENGEVKIFVGKDIEELMINYCFEGKYSDNMTEVTYKNADILYDIHKILKEYKNVLDNNGVDIIPIKNRFFILEV